MPPELFVAFHPGRPDRRQLQDAFREAVLAAAPDAAHVFTTEEMIRASREGGTMRDGFRCHVNGGTADDAMDIVQGLAGGRRVAVVTLSGEMVRAADARSFSVVSVGPTPSLAARQYIAASPAHIGDMLKMVTRERR
jgi:hypothetical protein